MLILLPFWLMKGKAHLKRRIAENVTINAASLPFRADFLAWLRTQASEGVQLTLVTASDKLLAEPVAACVGIFCEVLATDGALNLAGGNKARVLVERYGERGFDYAGNSRVDLQVWSHAREAIVVNGSTVLIESVRTAAPVSASFARTPLRLKTLLKAIRVRQWVKNALVFVPLLTSFRLLNASAFEADVLAFLSFSFCASSVYLLNDLLDLESDRLHPKKKNRPFASGALPIAYGVVMAPILLLAGFLVAMLLPREALGLLVVYYVLTFAYSFYLKRKMLVDVFTLSGLYTIRVLMGGAASGILCSPWLIAFSMFIFLSLAFSKRCSELFQLKKRETDSAAGRSYFVWDQFTMNVFGIASAYVSAIVLGLYIYSPEIRGHYLHPNWLWLLVLLLLYWLSRVWILAGRGAMDEDPIVFATTDRVTYASVAITVALLYLAARGPFGVLGMQELAK
jgi:4-hydroxybenzoate polyprenyltransferase